MLHKFPDPSHPSGAPFMGRTEPLLMDDTALAILLSRTAALLGHAVPVHRFGMAEHSQDGIELALLSRQKKAVEMWKSRFVGATIHVLRPEGLDAGSTPKPLPAVRCCNCVPMPASARMQTRRAPLPTGLRSRSASGAAFSLKASLRLS
jgi:hypothetical protein